jgi:hypothetical protein
VARGCVPKPSPTLRSTLVGLRGVVKVSHATVHGISVLNLDGFAPAGRWEELSSGTSDVRGDRGTREVAS